MSRPERETLELDAPTSPPAAEPAINARRRRAWLAGIAVGAAMAVAGFLIEVGLDQVVTPYPWFVLSFAAIVAATLIAGPVGGLTAAAVSWSLDSVVLPRLIPVESFRSILDAVNDALAFGAGMLFRARLPAGLGFRTAAPPAPARQPAAQLLETVSLTIDELAGSRSPAQIADTLARRLVDLSGAESAAVYVRARPADPIMLRARAGGGKDVPTGPQRVDLADDGPLGEAARSAQWGVSPTRLTIPILIGTEVAGIVDLSGPDLEIDARTRSAAVGIVRLAADAIERDRLRVERRAASTDAAAASTRIASFSRLAADLAGAVMVEEVGELLVDHAVSALRAAFGLLYVQDRFDGPCRLIHARGYPVGLTQRETTLSLSTDGPATRAVRTRAPVEIPSPEAYREEFPANSDLPAMTGTRSLVALPLGEGERLDGVLVVGWATGGPLGDDDRAILVSIADQGAQALERSRLHAQEREAHRMQDAFISVISHELRTPITTILAGSRLLRRRAAAEPSGDDLAADIEAEADRLFRIVEDLLVLSRLERRNLSIAQEPVHLYHLVTRVIASEARRWPGTTFVGPERAEVRVARGEETYIEQVLRNLLANAAKYAPIGSTVEVLVEDDADGVAVRVLDEGPGIAREEVEQLFGLFYRSPATAATAAGAGIGLFVSRHLVDEMGGAMWARARPGGGSEFGFLLSTFPIEDDDVEAIVEGAEIGDRNGDERADAVRDDSAATARS
jgi:K+-sensing histidine kinase KdpD